MFKRYRLLKNEPCPCNSGKPYKKCCKTKPPKQYRNADEMIHNIGQLMKQSRKKLCLYPGCKTKGIRAHAIQENRILDKLAENNCVLMQDFTKNPIICEIESQKPEPLYFLSEVTIADATTATCFCSYHDNTIFTRIEKSQYTLETLDCEQLFLFAYKTLSFELYVEIVAKYFYASCFSTIPQTTHDPLTIIQYRQNLLRLGDLEYYNNYLNQALLNKNYSDLKTVVLEIPYQIQFVNYMTISPPFDFYGKKINAIDKKTKRLKFMFFTLFPVENKSYILISYLREDAVCFNNFIDQARKAPLNLIQYYMNIFIPLYSQNLILSPRLWNSWSEDAQCGLQAIVSSSKSRAYLKSLQFHLKHIIKSSRLDEISPTSISFNFFIRGN